MADPATERAEVTASNAVSDIVMFQDMRLYIPGVPKKKKK